MALKHIVARNEAMVFHGRIPGESNMNHKHGVLRYCTSPEYGHKTRGLLPGGYLGF